MATAYFILCKINPVNAKNEAFSQYVFFRAPLPIAKIFHYTLFFLRTENPGQNFFEVATYGHVQVNFNPGQTSTHFICNRLLFYSTHHQATVVIVMRTA